jgi:hypothetical protein
MASRNRLAFWVNDRKSAANQPDYKGKFELSWELLQEANAAFNSGQYETDYNGQPCIKLDVALYAQQVNPGDKKPILSGSVSTLTETQNSALARQQAAQGYGGAPQQQAPQQPQYAQPQQPQGYPPQAAPQGYAQAPVQQGTQLGPWGQPGPEVAAGIMAVHAQHLAREAGHGQAPVPQPVYQQQAPQAYAQPLAQGQAPMPVAPPAPVQPMPGAIHGQPPAGLAPQLPPGF